MFKLRCVCDCRLCPVDSITRTSWVDRFFSSSSSSSSSFESVLPLPLPWERGLATNGKTQNIQNCSTRGHTQADCKRHCGQITSQVIHARVVWDESTVGRRRGRAGGSCVSSSLSSSSSPSPPWSSCQSAWQQRHHRQTTKQTRTVETTYVRMPAQHTHTHTHTHTHLRFFGFCLCLCFGTRFYLVDRFGC